MQDDLKDAIHWADWLLSRYHELPAVFEPHVVDAVRLARQFVKEVRAIESESEECFKTYFQCGRIPSRTL